MIEKGVSSALTNMPGFNDGHDLPQNLFEEYGTFDCHVLFMYYFFFEIKKRKIISSLY